MALTVANIQGSALRFGVLYSGAALEAWQVRCLEDLASVAEVSAAACFSPEGLRVPLPVLDPDAPHIPVSLSAARPPGPAQTAVLPSTSLARAQGLQLDFVLSFCDGAVSTEFLDIPRLGVWRFQFGDWTRYRGAPGGFWEVYDACATSAAMLVRVHADPDVVTVLRELHLRTPVLSPHKNRRRLAEGLVHCPAQVCRELQRGVRDASGPLLRSSARVRRPPTRAQRLVAGARIGARAVSTGLRSFFRHDQWNIGIVDRPIAEFLTLKGPAPVRWLPATPRAEFRADPFGMTVAGKPTILCEYYSYKDDRGFIVATDPEATGPHTRVHIGPEPPVHLSYPYLFEHEGRLFCVPESSAAREITVFEAERFPDRWKKVATLVTGRGFADASLFQHDGRWWLAASDVADHGANSELHLWFATDPSGVWQPHPGNPVKIDVRSSRPGGTPFRAGGELYRPAQDCSSTYGARIVINRVVELTPTTFREEVAATVDPDPRGPYPQGLHTLSAMGQQTLIDGKRHVFAAAQMFRVLRHYL